MYNEWSDSLEHGKMDHGNMIDELPEELLAEILIKLRVKDILKCMCVEKSWYYLIKTPMFMTLHLNHQKITFHKYLLFMRIMTTSYDTLTIRSDNVQCKEYCSFKRDHPGLPRQKNIWCTQSYGLICMSSMFEYTQYTPRIGYHPNIHLWNPLVRKCKTVPASPLSNNTIVMWKALAFGFLPEVNDYVVVHIVKPRSWGKPDPHSVIIGVYSLNTNSWKITRQDNVFICDINRQEVVFVNGAAFWLGVNLRKHQIVVCFDTKTDRLREILLPDFAAIEFAASPSIHPFGQSFACFVTDDGFNSLHIWVLKDDPINVFGWEKKIIVNSSQVDLRAVLGVRNNGEPIFMKSRHFISYNLHNHEPNYFDMSWDRWKTLFVSPFVETLALLND